MRRSKTQNITLLISIAIATVLGTTVMMLSSSEHRSSAEKSLNSSVTVDTSFSPTNISFKSHGQDQVFQLEYTAKANFTNNGSSKSLIAGMESTLYSHALNSKEKGIHIAYSLDVRRFSNNLLAPEIADGIRRELEKPFIVVYTPSGEVTQIKLPADMDNKAGKLIREVMSHLQFSRSKQEEWDAEHDEPRGRALVAHKWLPGKRIFKEKRKMLSRVVNSRLVPISKLDVLPESHTATGILSIDTDETILSAEVSEVITVHDPQIDFSSHAEVHVKLRRDTSRAPRLVSVSAGSLHVRGIYNGASDRAEHPTRPLDKIIEDMNTAKENAEFAKLQNAQYELIQSLSQNSDQVLKLLEDDTKLNQPIIAAMVISGTSESQVAMSEFIRDANRDPQLRQNAVTAFHFVAGPEQSSIEALFELIDDPHLGTTALLAVGGTVAKQSLYDEESARQWVATLVDMLVSATEDSRKIELLDALGNTRQVAAYVPIVAMVEDNESESVQTSALSNLRLIPDSRADLIIAGHIDTDMPYSLIEAAMDAAVFRASESMLGALQHVLEYSDSDLWQQKALNTVGGYFLSNKNNAAKEVLEWGATNCSSGNLRETARRLLEDGTST